MDRDIKKKAKASAVAAVTAASLLVGGSYAAPDDIFSDDADAIVQLLTPSASDGDGASNDSGDGERRARRGVRSAVRGFAGDLPESVRALVILPLWLLGTLGITLWSALWSALLSPVASTVLGWLSVVLIALAVYAMTVKAVFPDIPLKKILNKRSILTAVLGCFVFAVADALLPLVCDDHERLSQLMKLAASLICTLAPTAFLLRRHSMKHRASDKAGSSRAESERAARELVSELADSVCPKYR